MKNFLRIAKDLREIAEILDKKAQGGGGAVVGDEIDTAASFTDEGIPEDIGDEELTVQEELRKYLPLLRRMIPKESFGKLKILFDNKRKRKQDRFWAITMDKGEGAGPVGDMQEVVKQLRYILRSELPVAGMIRKVLDYGVENGYIALDRVLSKGQVKVRLLKEETAV
jgi:hypothetical protein